MSTATEKQFDQGLVNTIAAETQMSFIDGEKGGSSSTSASTSTPSPATPPSRSRPYLLWNGRLPEPRRARRLRGGSSGPSTPSPPGVLDDDPRDVPADASTDARRADPRLRPRRSSTPEGRRRHPRSQHPQGDPARRQDADPHRRVRSPPQGQGHRRPPTRIDRSPSNFLWMLRGEEPTETMVRALDVCLVLHADHGFNASTFTSLVVISDAQRPLLRVLRGRRAPFAARSTAVRTKV